MAIPAPGTPADIFAVLDQAIAVGHKQRTTVILEAASAMALKLKMEGKMDTATWTDIDAAITAMEQAGAVTVAALNQLGPAAQAAIPPATLAAGVNRLNAMTAALLDAVAKHTATSSDLNAITASAKV